MASTNKTPNLNLPQWVASDKPERVDFNQAMSDIDSNLNLVDAKADSVTTNFNNSFVGNRAFTVSDVFATALAAPAGRITYFTTGAATTGLPDSADAWTYASGLVLKRAANFIIIVLFYGFGGRIAMNTTNNGGTSWTGWATTIF